MLAKTAAATTATTKTLFIFNFIYQTSDTDFSTLSMRKNEWIRKVRKACSTQWWGGEGYETVRHEINK